MDVVTVAVAEPDVVVKRSPSQAVGLDEDIDVIGFWNSADGEVTVASMAVDTPFGLEGPSFYLIDADGLSEPERFYGPVTVVGGATTPLLSRDGQWLALPLGLGFSQFAATVPVQSGATHTIHLTPTAIGAVSDSLTFTPDASRLLFLTENGDLNSAVPGDSTLPVVIAQNVDVTSPLQVTDDGTRVVFRTSNAGAPFGVAPVDGSAPASVLTSATPGTPDCAARITPNSKALVYSATDGPGELGLFRVALDGASPPVPLTNLAAGESVPTGSSFHLVAQGSRVVFPVTETF